MKLGTVVARIHAQIDGTKIEPGTIKASEAEKITGWTGYSLREWEVKLVGEGDPLAARALLALMEFRKGTHVRFSDLDVEDVDSIDADFYDDSGRKVDVKVDDDGNPVLDGGKPVILLDGEPVDPPTVAPQTS